MILPVIYGLSKKERGHTMSAISNRLIKTIEDKGWLALSNIYFDNAVALNITNSLGYVAYSANEGLVFWLSNQDTMDTSICENRYVYMNPSMTGHLVTLVAQDIECCQHFEYALYSKFNFYWDDETVFPMPTIPDKKGIMRLEKNEETGLYEGADVLYGLKQRYSHAIPKTGERVPVSTIMMYTDEQFDGAPKDVFNAQNYETTGKPFFDYPSYPKGIASTLFGSGINIDGWKAFYTNQEKFALAVAEYTGITDVK